MRCQGHTTSVTSEETTVIEIDANPHQDAQYKATDDPEVAAMLKSLGINKVEDHVYQDNKQIDKVVSYVVTVSNTEKAKYLMQKVAEILPEFIDDDDVKTIDDAIDDIAMIEKQKRLIIGVGSGIDRPKRKRKILKILFFKIIIEVVIEILF